MTDATTHPRFFHDETRIDLITFSFHQPINKQQQYTQIIVMKYQQPKQEHGASSTTSRTNSSSSHSSSRGCFVVLFLFMLLLLNTNTTAHANENWVSSSPWSLVLERNLRGSSSKGGSRGGGSRTGNGNNYYNDGGGGYTAGVLPFWGILAIVGFFLLFPICFVGALCVGCWKRRTFQKVVAQADQETMSDTAEDERKEVTVVEPPTSYEQREYSYSCSHEKDGDLINSGNLRMLFIKNEGTSSERNYYDISGSGLDCNNIPIDVLYGKVNGLNGTAYWVTRTEAAVAATYDDRPCLNILFEQLYNRCNPVETLSQGTFDFKSNTFTGFWKTNTGGSPGAYTMFRGPVIGSTSDESDSFVDAKVELSTGVEIY